MPFSHKFLLNEKRSNLKINLKKLICLMCFLYQIYSTRVLLFVLKCKINTHLLRNLLGFLNFLGNWGGGGLTLFSF